MSTESGSQEESSNEGYSVTDPGYEFLDPVEDSIESLRAENTKTPSETSDDASKPEGDAEAGTDGGTEEAAEQPTSGNDAAGDFDISDELLDRAVAVGYELSDIRDFKDAKAFEKELARVERLQQRLQEKKTGAEPPADEEPPPEAEKEPDWDQLINDGHDPDIIELQKKNWQRATAAEAQVKELRRIETERAIAAQSDRFDEVLNGLGEEYTPLLGKGRRAELINSSPEVAANRQKVFTTMTILRTGYQQSGQPVPSDTELIQQAVQASFYKQTQELARSAIKRQIKNAGSQALSRPRSGGKDQLSGPDRALEKEREFWKSHS